MDNISSTETLFKGLSKRRELSNFDLNIFYDGISGSVVKKDCFCSSLPKLESNIEDSSRIYTLSLNCILNNKATSLPINSAVKFFYNSFIADIGSFSLDRLVSSLNINKDIVSLMDSSDSDLSVLGKLKTVYYDCSENRTYTNISPILIIPCYENDSRVSDWETMHSRNYKDHKFLGL